MGIVNVTPDSFSDGGRYLAPEAAVAQGRRLADEGADLLDIGGESTRPGAAPVPEAEEIARVVPVIAALAAEVRIPLSVDTMKPAVARAALDAGASIINDVAANRESAGMWELVAQSGAGYVAMHMQGTPRTMQQDPRYGDVVREVAAFFDDRLDRLQNAGVHAEQTVLDPGIGFGKTTEQNLELLRHVADLRTRARPIMLGISRKSFIGNLLGLPPHERVAAGLACTLWAAAEGVQIFRTHDVAATVQGLRMQAVLAGRNSGTA